MIGGRDRILLEVSVMKTVWLSSFLGLGLGLGDVLRKTDQSTSTRAPQADSERFLGLVYFLRLTIESLCLSIRNSSLFQDLFTIEDILNRFKDKVRCLNGKFSQDVLGIFNKSDDTGKDWRLLKSILRIKPDKIHEN